MASINIVGSGAPIHSKPEDFIPKPPKPVWWKRLIRWLRETKSV